MNSNSRIGIPRGQLLIYPIILNMTTGLKLAPSEFILFKFEEKSIKNGLKVFCNGIRW
jgi:hypothetical protein